MSPILIALDVDRVADATRLVDGLAPLVGGFKIGKQLFVSEGPAAVAPVIDRGLRLFLDLKFHDIPNTVRGAVQSASRLGAALVTVHASGGLEMMSAAVEGAGEGCRVLGVTVLTSLNSAALARSWGRDVSGVSDEVLRLAELVRSSGAHGVVCSAREAAAVRAEHGDALELLVPGIRLDGGPSHDQARVATPSEAVAAGADYIVLGRAVTTASDPRAVMRRVKEMLQ